MSVAELKKSVLALPPGRRRKFAQWVQKIEPVPEKFGGDPITDDEIVAMTAATWRELDEREAEDERRKARRSVAR